MPTKTLPKAGYAMNRAAEADESLGPSIIAGIKVRWRWVMWFTLSVPLIVMGVLEKLPSQYTSKATLALIQAQVPKQYVDQLASGSSSEMINAVTRDVLSLPRLGGIAERFVMFPELRQTLTSEQLGEELRKQIEVRPVDQVNPKAEFTAFAISFTNSDPKLAQQVLSQLCTLFVEVNLKDREERARSTATFLAGQLELAKKRLDEKEQVLMKARVANASQNPTVNSAKLSVVSDLRVQTQVNAANVSRMQQQVQAIQTSLNAALRRLEDERKSLLETFTEQHPEVRRRTTEISGIQAALRGGNAGLDEKDSAIGDPVIADLAAQLLRGRGEIVAWEAQGKALRSEMDKLNRTLLQSSPASEQQLTVAEKDYELLRADYADLQAKYFRSQISANMEGELSGQQFKLIDPPTLPALPSSPKRLRVSLLSIGIGLLLGIVVAGSFEVLRPTYLTNKEVATAHPAALLIDIPMMLTPGEERRAKVAATAHIVVGCLVAVAVSLWAYRMYLNDAR